jgi:low affinity Fe/Cu permease
MPAKPKKRKSGWTTKIGGAAAHPAAFGVVILYALVWLAFDRRTFDFNAFATLAVWMMTLFIQRSSHRDTQALHAKLDELLRADTNARSELSMLDEKEPEAIAKHRDAEVKALKRVR